MRLFHFIYCTVLKDNFAFIATVNIIINTFGIIMGKKKGLKTIIADLFMSFCFALIVGAYVVNQYEQSEMLLIGSIVVSTIIGPDFIRGLYTISSDFCNNPLGIINQIIHTIKGALK